MAHDCPDCSNLCHCDMDDIFYPEPEKCCHKCPEYENDDWDGDDDDDEEWDSMPDVDGEDFRSRY